MKTFSMDLRQRVVDAWDQKTGTQPEIAQRFKVSVGWVKKLLRQRRRSGSIAPGKRGGRKRPIFSGERLERLRQFVEDKPDATLEELLESSGVSASLMAVSRALRRLGFTFKKSRYAPRSKTVPTSKCAGKRGGKKQKT
jgi:transposase